MSQRTLAIHRPRGLVLFGALALLCAPAAARAQSAKPIVPAPAGTAAAQRLTDPLQPKALPQPAAPAVDPARPAPAGAQPSAPAQAVPAAEPVQAVPTPAQPVGPAATPEGAAPAAAPPSGTAPAAAPPEGAAPAAAPPAAAAPEGAAPHEGAAAGAAPHEATSASAHEGGAERAAAHAGQVAAEHGEAAAHEATHDSAEGGHEEGPVIENWFSFDYGPGKTHHHPPFGFALINFAVFAFLVYRLAGKSMVEFLNNRHLGVRKALDEAKEIRQKAEAQLRRFEERTARIDADVEALLLGVRKEAEAERSRIIAAAEIQADQMRKDAEAQVAAEISRANADLRAQVARAAVAAAEAILKSQITEGDQKRLLDDYVARLEGRPAAPRAPRSTPGRPA